ncbi:restriction modification system DNA specificity domain protein [Brachyspira pilosicoli B2904]|uniref:Restriction modification system DNA specificity domain protein n=1 Tax=Brachyspira pilosicoli B2904 TaxID=1133568 RepID=J9TUM8_BRAPL|nr:restriction endonuclease subunit S [Brachyspira pilosicoli]AFR70317.1 restriction modification system DNA specificity domain protein [Brachyspira pilosicoli B2904]
MLNELDIKIDDNIKKEKCFTVKYSEIKNKRIDATYYSKNNQIKSKFDLEELDEYKSFCDSGSRPKGGVANIKNGIFSFGGEHIKDDGRVVMYPTKYIPEDFNKKILNTSLKLNDILIVKDGATTGKIGIVDDIKCENQNINEHLFLLRAKKELNQKYLFFILSNKIFQQIIKSKITGATVMGIIKNEILNIKIPIPPIEIQNKIADEATNRREKAFKLQEEAKNIIEEAKKEVESILF